LGRKTVLYDEHVRLGGRLIDFHGWDLPVQYESILAEHRHCREAACLFDTSHMGQILIRARPADLNRITTQNAESLAVGRGGYGFLLSEAGGILDDTVLMRLGDEAPAKHAKQAKEEFLLVVNAATADADFDWVKAHLPANAEALKQSPNGWAKVDLQGPASAKVLGPLTETKLASLGYFRNTRTRVCGRDCLLSRTGYTGELGYEVFAPGESIAAIFRELLGHPLVKPAGLGARDSLRLEIGYPLHGADIGPDTTPFEAGLGMFIKFGHDFIGSAALRALAAETPKRLRVAFASESRQRAWGGNEIWRGARKVGAVTSAAFSPSLNVSIGMGYVAPEVAEPGTGLIAKTPRGDLALTVREMPLYRNGTCRTKEL